MITFKTNGTAGNGTTSVTPAYPASIAAGDTLILYVVNKYPSNGPTTPSGWTLVNQTSGGNGSSGTDTGNVYVSVYTKVATGSESGTLTVSVPSSNCTQSGIYRYTSFGPVTVTGIGIANNVASASWSVTFGSDPGIQSGDVLLVVSGENGNNGSASGGTLACTGMTFTTQGGSPVGISTGDHIYTYVTRHDPAIGLSSAAPTYTFTQSAGTPAGATVLIRLREDAIQYGGRGAVASGTTALSVAYPTNISAGDGLVLSVVNKYPTNGPSTPAGWNLASQASGGTGVDTTDSGHTYTTVFTRTADGSETGSVSVTLTSANVAQGVITRYFRTGRTLLFGASNGSVNSAGTAWSATMAADPGIVAGSFIVSVSGINTNANSYSGAVIAATGCTFETAVAPSGAAGTSATGGHMGFQTHHTACRTGVASAPAVMTMTASGTAGSEPAGGTVLLAINSESRGALAQTLASPSLSATGSAPITGSESGTLASPTLSGLGVSPIVGTSSKTLDAATVSGTGVAPVVGTLNKTLADAAISAAGVSTIVGTESATLGDATVSGAGSAPIKGALSKTLDAATVGAAGTAPITGSESGTLDAATVGAAGRAPIVGTESSSLDAATVAASGRAPIVGSGASGLAAATGAATGTSPVVGSLAATTGGATVVGAGTAPIVGHLAGTLGDATLFGGSVAIEGTLASTLDAATVTGAAAVYANPPLGRRFAIVTVATARAIVTTPKSAAVDPQ